MTTAEASPRNSDPLRIRGEDRRLSDVLAAVDLRAAATVVAEVAIAAEAIIAEGKRPLLDPFAVGIVDRIRPVIEAGVPWSEGEEPRAAVMDELGFLLQEAVTKSVKANAPGDFITERALLDLAVDARQKPPTPSSPLALASQVTDLLGETTTERSHRRKLLGVGAALLVLAAIGWTALQSGPADPEPLTQPTASTATDPTNIPQADQPPTTIELATTATSDSSAVATAPPALEYQGVTYDIGEPGDIVVLGDWWCRDLPTAAVLRPATGQLYVFERWPDDDEADLAAPTPQPVGTNAADLTSESVGDCDRLVVQHADGTEQVVTPGGLG